MSIKSSNNTPNSKMCPGTEGVREIVSGGGEERGAEGEEKEKSHSQQELKHTTKAKLPQDTQRIGKQSPEVFVLAVNTRDAFP